MAFELGDNRIIHADEVAFCDLCIAAKFAPITLRKVLVYILSQEGAKDIMASEFHEEEALNQLFQVMKLKVCQIS